MTLFIFSFIDDNPVCDSSVKKRWFSDLVGLEDGHLMGTFTSCHKKPLASCSNLSGFTAKQAEAAQTVADSKTTSEYFQRTLFFPHEVWMEMFILDGIFITPTSFLLNFKPKQLSEKDENSSDVTHGVLCLFMFNAKEYVYHWYDNCQCF